MDCNKCWYCMYHDLSEFSMVDINAKEHYKTKPVTTTQYISKPKNTLHQKDTSHIVPSVSFNTALGSLRTVKPIGPS